MKKKLKDLCTELLELAKAEHAEAGCDNQIVRDTGECPVCVKLEEYEKTLK
jgi:hypothetical protein